MLALKKVLDQLADIRPTQVFAGLDRRRGGTQKAEGCLRVEVHEISTIGAGAHVQEWPARIDEADSRRAGFPAGVLELAQELPLVRPGVRVQRTKRAGDVDRGKVGGREIGPLNPVLQRHFDWGDYYDPVAACLTA